MRRVGHAGTRCSCSTRSTSWAPTSAATRRRRCSRCSTPSRTRRFSDHYLEVNFDLSDVIFIATANMLDPIPPALLDRMEVLEIPGYTREEKLEIAQAPPGAEADRRARPRRRADQLLATRRSTTIIEQYTREAGVRNLEREIASVIRGVAVKVAENQAYDPNADARRRSPTSSARRSSTRRRRSARRSRAWRRAWPGRRPAATSCSSRRRAMPGKGSLILTGQLGDVMKESARAALSWVRTHVEDLGITTDFEKTDIHLHVPAGAVSKDGPSAGVAITVGAGVAADRAARARRRRDDRRDHAARDGAAGRRHQGEGAGGPPRRHQAGASCPSATARTSSTSRRRSAQELEIVFVKKIDEVLELTLEAVPVVVPGPGDPASPRSRRARRETPRLRRARKKRRTSPPLASYPLSPVRGGEGKGEGGPTMGGRRVSQGLPSPTPPQTGEGTGISQRDWLRGLGLLRPRTRLRVGPGATRACPCFFVAAWPATAALGFSDSVESTSSSSGNTSGSSA